MKRPKSHIIGESYRGYLEKTINPLGWIFREKDKDYGIDGEIEIVENGELTGKILWLQIKSTEELKIINNEIHYQLNAENIKYYMKCDMPVILFIYGAKEDVGYWIWIQRYVYQNEKYFLKDQKSFVIKISMVNIFHKEISELRDIANNGISYIVQKRLGILPEIIKYEKSKIGPISKMLNRKWDKLKIYDMMNGHGVVSESEIKFWFQEETEIGTDLFFDTPMGKYKMFTPIVPDLLETLEDMAREGMIEIQIEFSPIPYAALDPGGMIHIPKLMIEDANSKLKPLDHYPEITCKCKKIGREILNFREMYTLREKEPVYFYKK